MNLSEINSVDDLIKANETPVTDFEKGKSILKQVYKLDPAYGRAIAIHIMENLLGFHVDMMESNIKEGDAKYAAIWSRDVARIDDAITNLKQVDLTTDKGDDVRYDEV